MSADESEDKFSVLDAPSIGSDPNANPNAFKIPLNNFYQTVTPSGTITKDQVFATATTDEVVPPDAVAQYAVYLNTTNKVKPVINCIRKWGRVQDVELQNWGCDTFNFAQEMAK